MSAQTFGPGDLVKLQDDGDLETTGDSAVYYVGTDGRRYVFPNSQAYFTWYEDFSLVKIVSAGELAAMQLGGNVTYRPGTRLVKITSDPNVYAVEPGGVLRWIQTEAVALGLYGSEWNKRIDDISDAFFLNYSIGDPLAAAVWPDGTVVKRTSDGVYFRIEDRTKRKIVSAEVRTALRIDEDFVIATSGDLSDYPTGADIATAETSITDTSQKNLTQLPSVPTFTVRTPATTYIAVGGEATLLELHIASLPSVRLDRIAVKLDATTNNPVDAGTDDDKGGLVYQNNAQPNFTLLRFVDAQGNEVFGKKSIALDISRDQSQTFEFSGGFNVPGGTDQVLYLRAMVNTLLPTGEGYRVTLPLSGIGLVDASTGGAAVFQPQADIVGPTLTSLNAKLEVSISGTPGSKTYVRGATNAEIAGFNFKATTVAPNVIKKLTVQGYIDEEGTAGFLPGTDSDNGSETRVNAMLPAVGLYDKDGVKIAGPVPVDLDGKATFDGLLVSIPAGQTKLLVVRGDVSATVELENNPNKITFDVFDAESDVSVVDDKGAKVLATGNQPNRGVTPTFFATVKKTGRAAFSWTGSGGGAIVGRETLLGTLSVDVKDDSYELTTATFRFQGAAPVSLGQVRLEYPVGAATASQTQSFIGNAVTFTNLPAVLEKEKISALKLYGRIIAKDAGARNAETIAVLFGNGGPLTWRSVTNDEVFGESNLSAEPNADFSMGQNTASSAIVRFSGLRAEKASDSPSQTYRDSAAPVLKFLLKAEPEGPVKVRSLTFKVTPHDPGKTGANNDALELWADVNGDFSDDDGIINLKQVVGTNTTVIGEDSSTRIMFSVVQGGVKNTSPSAIPNTNAGDYGLIEYVFNEGTELAVGAGGTAAFTVELKTGDIASSASDQQLMIELLGAADFQWTEVPTGAYSALSGVYAVGLPVSATVSLIKNQ